ncbi:hypothetical protein [Yokenella regensburgei]|uniref:hypothetical protein n=1 Tax=Yokenella regensburgei TaxID=158877 RepID=UPI00289B4384|nr:hypothetical protein [Yokenella regensburgei]
MRLATELMRKAAFGYFLFQLMSYIKAMPVRKVSPAATKVSLHTLTNVKPEKILGITDAVWFFIPPSREIARLSG